MAIAPLRLPCETAFGIFCQGFYCNEQKSRQPGLCPQQIQGHSRFEAVQHIFRQYYDPEMSYSNYSALDQQAGYEPGSCTNVLQYHQAIK